VAFAPKLREGDEELSDEAYSRHPLFTPSRHQRSSVLSRLIDALSLLHFHGGAAGRSARRDGE
jgi:hypothetical protein